MRKVKQRPSLRLTRIAWFIALALSGTAPVYARDYFNPELLETGTQTAGADLSAFEEGSQAPGTYQVDVVINDQQVDSRNVEFKSVKNAAGEDVLEPCLSVALLQSYGVKTELFPELGAEDACANLSAIPDASYDFRFNSQILALSIPQAAMSPQARGYVDPALWDNGINALMMNYSISGSSTHARGGNGGSDTNSQYANLRPGINVGPWRLRNYTTWNRDSNGQDKWDTVYTYAQRNIVPLKSQLTLGDSSSPSDVFDSVPFRGGQLASDDDMLPDSLKGYAPVVRGIARTNAQVVIRQNGYVIYQSYVAPGAFEITDMYPTGGAGDLNVTVKEADGSEQKFTVAFASLPVLQREGHLKYSLTGGQYRSYDRTVEKTQFAQVTGIYGISHGVTLYGGVQASSRYHSLALGLGKNMGQVGAFSVDVTQASAELADDTSSTGQSWRIRYSKNFAETGTNFSIAGYRYSTRGYYSMQEVLDGYGENNIMDNRRRNRAELTMSQSLGGNLGALSLSAVREDYWNSDKSMESWSASYNNSWNGISYGLTYTLSKNGSAGNYGNSTSYDKDQMVALNVSFPLERFLPKTWASYSMNNNKNSGTTHSVGISGMALENNALSWNLQEGYGSNGTGNTGSLNGDYKGTYGEVTAGYGYDKSSKRLNYGLQGSILAHADGVTLSQPLSETNVLIKAPGAKGVSIQNQTGAKTDFRGYTVVSNVSPYRKNDVTLDPSSLPDDVELELTSRTVVPTRGAVVRAEYVASVGMRVLMTLTQANGQPVPFGALANVEGHPGQGYIVGDAGQVYLTGLEPKGNMIVKWGEATDQMCLVKYSLPSNEANSGVIMSEQSCN
ncbi:fimbria/pilus outer membrane usher protein [Siccibacter colletis]|uniref:Fimbrial biogenesis outer membrane usher protein n=1 Tax=Siccibacter colletis TaxID=1505757 RepID=A0ABY6J9Q0_9ENTR|nr:fimbria/pilus outer membrane usher protein [Siccibacter colletis]UYU30499.1 fimbrial biogenesis outer membrane usher protein [Siccibacter colletis]